LRMVLSPFRHLWLLVYMLVELSMSFCLVEHCEVVVLGILFYYAGGSSAAGLPNQDSWERVLVLGLASSLRSLYDKLQKEE
jgi:hypothetical protein